MADLPSDWFDIGNLTDRFGGACFLEVIRNQAFTDEVRNGIFLAETRNGRGFVMKKNEFSELASNLLIFGSISLAFMPFLLGDRLIQVVTGLMTEGGVMIDQVNNYVSWLIS